MEKILEKSGKSQGILSVRKSGNPGPAEFRSFMSCEQFFVEQYFCYVLRPDRVNKIRL